MSRRPATTGSETTGRRERRGSAAAAGPRRGAESGAELELLRRGEALTHVGSFELDPRTGAMRWSAGALRLLGIRGGARGPDRRAFLVRFVDPAYRDRLGAALDGARSSGASVDAIVRLEPRAGQSRWIHLRGSVLSGRGGKPRLFGSLHDVTEREEAEEALRAERGLVDRLFSTAHVLVVVLDAQGRIVRCNPFVEEVCGRPLRELAGRDWVDSCVPEEARPRVRGLFASVVDGHPTRGAVSPILTRDGAQRLVEWYDSVLREEEGRVEGVLAVGLDVTERAVAEEALREQAALAHLGKMAAMVAHEVRNPLAGARGALEILRRRLDGLDFDDGGIIGDVLARFGSLDQWIQDLLEYARPRPPRLESVSLRALLEGKRALLAENPECRDVSIDLQLDDPDVRVRADAGLLRSAVLNLLMNASQAMDGKGRIRVSVVREAAHCRIAVQDCGPGVPGPLRERIFEPFFTTRHRGSGLGLAVARRAVEVIGGRLDLESPSEAGARFVITLPTDGAATPA